MPVTHGVTGSSPVRTAKENDFFILLFYYPPFKVLSNVKSNRVCLKTLWVYYANSSFASVLSLRQPRCNDASMQSTITDRRKFSDRRPVLLTDANAIRESLSAFWKTQQATNLFTSFNNRTLNSALSSLYEAFIFVSSRILSKYLFNFRTEKERRWNEGDTKVIRRSDEKAAEKQGKDKKSESSERLRREFVFLFFYQFVNQD